MKVTEQIQSILRAEAEAISEIPVGPDFEKAIEKLLACRGKLFTTGIGKAGYVAQKAASTFCTTGCPAAFIHPGDASHGDVGAVAAGDMLLAFSNSGRTREVLETVHLARRLDIECVIVITAQRSSPLGQESVIALEIGTIVEPCPLGFTPSASTAAMCAVADALALTLMSERGFSRTDFATRHHGGYLGKKSREEVA